MNTGLCFLSAANICSTRLSGGMFCALGGSFSTPAGSRMVWKIIRWDKLINEEKALDVGNHRTTKQARSDRASHQSLAVAAFHQLESNAISVVDAGIEDRYSPGIDRNSLMHSLHTWSQLLEPVFRIKCQCTDM
jgi:hypothetical protein